jgi:hypothetical protein
MSDEDFDKYFNGRFAEAVSFYDKRAKQNKWGYRLCSLYVILVSATLAGLGGVDTGITRLLIVVLAPTVTIVTGALALFQLQENWLSYRSTWDALKREPSLRMAGVGEYDGAADRNGLFVQRVEGLIAGEGVNWLARQARKEDSAQRLVSNG